MRKGNGEPSKEPTGLAMQRALRENETTREKDPVAAAHDRTLASVGLAPDGTALAPSGVEDLAAESQATEDAADGERAFAIGEADRREQVERLSSVVRLAHNELNRTAEPLTPHAVAAILAREGVRLDREPVAGGVERPARLDPAVVARERARQRDELDRLLARLGVAVSPETVATLPAGDVAPAIAWATAVVEGADDVPAVPKSLAPHVRGQARRANGGPRRQAAE
jgi:hypothetical protein